MNKSFASYLFHLFSPCWLNIFQYEFVLFMATLRYLDKIFKKSSEQEYFYKRSLDLTLLKSKIDNPRDVKADTRYHAQQDRSLQSSSTIYCLLMSSTLLYLPTKRYCSRTYTLCTKQVHGGLYGNKS